MNCLICGAPLDFIGQDLERRLQCRDYHSHQMTLRELYEYLMKRKTMKEIKVLMAERSEAIKRKTYRI